MRDDVGGNVTCSCLGLFGQWHAEGTGSLRVVPCRGALPGDPPLSRKSTQEGLERLALDPSRRGKRLGGGGSESRGPPALTNIATKKSLFDALPITGLGSVAKANIKTLSTDTSTFETAFINASPADIKLNATAVVNTINTAFTTAIAANTSEA
ncbi:hypothetical protein M422DRAFT_782255 [Sphaerobolus stellatus SS14]|uniref:Uncharacterized protein n=1 Tax=Sphaerobolus stellatus (strain SS14) TaxID=990650 RepID=A0A0C9UNA0_SPHS4|nr:hypothetical protein M422DRAFT_782255 [Sphaerobolus stellatus SS14]